MSLERLIGLSDHQDERLEALVRAGLQRVVLRDLGRPVDQVTALAERLEDLGAEVWVHAKISESTGRPLHVHAARLNEPAPPGRWAASTHTPEEARRAFILGAEHVFLSPAFSPTSKPGDRRPTWGVVGIARAQRRLGRPVYALGGVTPERARLLRQRRVYGVAVLGGLYTAEPADALVARYARSLA